MMSILKSCFKSVNKTKLESLAQGSLQKDKA